MEKVRLTIAVVDDDPAMCRALRRLLGLAGFDVHTFASSEEFLARADAQRLSACLVLDVHMEGMSGPELREELIRRGEEVNVVFITAHDDEATWQRVREAAGIPCLRKPFDETLLLEAIRRLTLGNLDASNPAP